MKAIATPTAPAALGPYSQAIDAGAFVFVSGQVPVNPTTGEIPLGAAAQAEQAFSNVRAILEAAGLGMDAVVKTTVFIRNMGDFGTVNEIYAAFFGDHKPARSCVEVSALPKNGLVEIEVTASK